MPATAETCRLPDGRRLAFECFGDHRGLPIFYCHGFPGSRLEARLAAAAARQIGVRLVAVDRPGFGASDPAPGRSLAGWSADIAALADHLGLERFHLVGVSGGGPYALACAERLARRLIAVAVVCGLGELSHRQASRGMAVPVAAALALARRLPRFSAHFYGKLVGPLIGAYPGLILRLVATQAPAPDRAILAEPAVRDALLASFREAFAQGGEGPAAELGVFTRPWDIDPRRIRVPVHLWHGALDRTVPLAMAKTHARLIPACRSAFLPDEGHFSLVVRHATSILAALAAA